jgi:hypothetical protein
MEMYGRVEYRPILNSALTGDEWFTPRSSREEKFLCPLDRKLAGTWRLPGGENEKFNRTRVTPWPAQRLLASYGRLDSMEFDMEYSYISTSQVP